MFSLTAYFTHSTFSTEPDIVDIVVLDDLNYDSYYNLIMKTKIAELRPVLINTGTTRITDHPATLSGYLVEQSQQVSLR